MKRMLAAVCMLTLVYALVLASFAPLDLAMGAAISAIVLRVFSRPVPGERPHVGPRLLIRLVAFFPFAAAVARDVALGTWNVATIAVGLRPVEPSGMVEVPIGDRTEGGIVVTALVATLSPGAILIDVDRERQILLFHVLGVEPSEFRSTQDAFYRRYQRWVFP